MRALPSSSQDRGTLSHHPARGVPPLDPIVQERFSLLRRRGQDLGDSVPNTPAKGALVKASSLREDGFAAALSWRCTHPLEPVSAGAYAPAESKNQLFWQKITARTKGNFIFQCTSGFCMLFQFCTRKRMHMRLPNRGQGQNALVGVLGAKPPRS